MPVKVSQPLLENEGTLAKSEQNPQVTLQAIVVLIMCITLPMHRSDL